MRRNSCSGYFLMMAVVMIVVMGMLGVVLTSMVSGKSSMTVAGWNGLNTFYLTESGLDVATHYLLRPAISGSPSRIACAAVTGNADLTNASLLSGTFTATAASPYQAVTTLSSGISASAASLSLSSAVGLSPLGRVYVDREAIDYAAVSGNTLLGVMRGRDGTIAASHLSGAKVGQYECLATIAGGIPSINSPAYQRQILAGVQLQGMKMVGARSGNDYMLLDWNLASELTVTNQSFSAGGSTDRGDVRSVDVLSNAEGWAVGDVASNQFIFLRWNGANWSKNMVAGACNGQDLYGVSLVTTTEGYAVGLRYRNNNCNNGPRRYTVLKWDGSSWSLLTPSTTPNLPNDNNANEDLRAVQVIDANGDGVGDLGFAVGDSGTILKYNGSSWTQETSPVTSDLFGVYIVSTQEAWAVGASGVILRWNGSSWSSQSSPVTSQLNGIAMLDTDGDGLANFGVIAGSSERILSYDGNGWSFVDLGGNALYSATIANSKDAWVVGAGGLMIHWDGSSWTDVSSGTGNDLYGISLVAAHRLPMASWRQVFN